MCYTKIIFVDATEFIEISKIVNYVVILTLVNCKTFHLCLTFIQEH